MQDLHWRYNFNTGEFDFVENNPQQHYEPLLKHVHRPTLVIDINLVPAQDLERYATEVLDQASASMIRFDQIIFDGTQDPVNDYQEKVKILDTFARAKGIKVYLALSQFDLQSHKHLKEINYPSWLFVFKKQNLPEANFGNRQYDFSCLNRNPTFHRLIFYTLIKQAGLLDQFIYTFYDRCPYQGFKMTPHHYRNIRSFVSAELYNQCLDSLSDFPVSWAGEQQGINDHTINHPAYRDTWCNVVTETSAVVSFTSEKIWKPIAAGQLFLIVGAPGTTSWLKQLGFYTFNDEYDLKHNLSSRLEMIVQRVQEQSQDPRAWYQANRFQIEHNYHWFRSGNVEKSILEPLVSQLNGETS